MGQEITVPDSFKGVLPSQAFGGLNAQEDSLADGIGSSFGVIHFTGKVWSLRYQGERKNFVRPDDGTPSAFLDIVVIGQTKGKSKTYYKDFKEGASDRPICSSLDGVVPDVDVMVKQNDNCATCPRNEWKSDPVSGRKKRECSDHKRLAVLVMPNQTKPLVGGDGLMEPILLRIPAASLKGLAALDETMSARGFHYSTYITRITFDPNKPHPEMVFRPLEKVPDDAAPAVMALRDDPLVARITGANTGAPRVVPQSVTAPVTTVSPLEKLAAQVQQPAVKQLGPADPEPSFGGEVTPTGFLNGGLVPQSAVEDVGEPEESDADLDAKIEALIKSRK